MTIPILNLQFQGPDPVAPVPEGDQLSPQDGHLRGERAKAQVSPGTESPGILVAM